MNELGFYAGVLLALVLGLWTVGEIVARWLSERSGR